MCNVPLVVVVVVVVVGVLEVFAYAGHDSLTLLGEEQHETTWK